MFKKIIFVIIILITVILFTALFVENTYQVKHSIIINKPKNDVFNYIKLTKNLTHYSVWSKYDPNTVQTYKGIDGEVGFISAWQTKLIEGDSIGSGEREIVAIEIGHRIDIEVRILTPYKTTKSEFTITEKLSDNQTKVIWGGVGWIDYPMNFMLLFTTPDDLPLNAFKEGLINLKNVLENEN